MIEKLYTVEEVAELASVTGRTIRNYLKSGRLIGRKIGGQWRFPEAEVQRLLAGGIVEAQEDEDFAELSQKEEWETQRPREAYLNFEEEGQALQSRNNYSADFVSEAAPVQSQTPVGVYYSPPAPLPTAPRPVQKPAPLPRQETPPKPQAPTQEQGQRPLPLQQESQQYLAYEAFAQPQLQPNQGYSPLATPVGILPQQQYSAMQAQPMVNLQNMPEYNHPVASAMQNSLQGYPVQEYNQKPYIMSSAGILYEAVPLPNYAYPQAYAQTPPVQAALPVQEKPVQKISEAAENAKEELPAKSAEPALQPSLSDVGKKVTKFISEVHDYSKGPQMCTVVDLHQAFPAAQITSQRLSEIADEESESGVLCQSFVEFDERFYVARYTLFGTTSFLLRCLKLIG